MYENRSKILSFFLFAYWHDPRWKNFVGATVKIWDLAQNLSKIGHNVTLFLPRYHFDINASSVKIVEIPFFNLPLLRFVSYNFFLVLHLVSLSFKNHPDIVYVRRMGSIVPGIYAKLVNAVFFYEVNDDPYRKDYHEGSLLIFQLRNFISQWQDEINLKLCRRAFVITRKILEKIQSKNPGLQAVKLIETPSGANCDHFRPMHAMECRSRLNIDMEKKYIGFAGTLLKHQGVDVIIDAAPAILSKEPSSCFIIMGEGPMKDIWMKEIESRGLIDNFIFTGQIFYQDMPVWLGAMSVCVAPFLPSAGLRSPVKIFDYMACGRPVVASRIAGTTDIFADSGAIRLVPAGDSKMLANGINELLSNREEAKKMGEKGRAFILEKYDRRIIAKRISDEALLFID